MHHGYYVEGKKANTIEDHKWVDDTLTLVQVLEIN